MKKLTKEQITEKKRLLKIVAIPYNAKLSVSGLNTGTLTVKILEHNLNLQSDILNDNFRWCLQTRGCLYLSSADIDDENFSGQTLELLEDILEVMRVGWWGTSLDCLWYNHIVIYNNATELENKDADK